MQNQTAFIILDGLEKIYIDNSVVINNRAYYDNCDRSLIDFIRDEIFWTTKSIINLSTKDAEYTFPSSKILLVKQFKQDQTSL